MQTAVTAEPPDYSPATQKRPSESAQDALSGTPTLSSPSENNPPPKLTRAQFRDSILDRCLAGELTNAEAAAILKIRQKSVKVEKSRRKRVLINAGVIDPEPEAQAYPAPPLQTQTLQSLQIVNPVNPVARNGENGQNVPQDAQNAPITPTSIPINPLPQPPKQTGAKGFLALRLAKLPKMRRLPWELGDKPGAAGEGSFEADELASLDGVHRKLAKKLGECESGRDAKGFADALGTVIELRRRALGKPSILVKPETKADVKQRAAVVVITGQPNASRAKSSRVIDGQVRAVPPSASDLDPRLKDAPPALNARLSEVPDYVRSL